MSLFHSLSSTRNVSVTLRAHQSCAGFTSGNNLTLTFTHPKGSTVHTLLTECNQFRSPHNQIKQLYTSTGQVVSPQTILHSDQVFYID